MFEAEESVRINPCTRQSSKTLRCPLHGAKSSGSPYSVSQWKACE
jgi:hypothetical protein